MDWTCIQTGVPYIIQVLPRVGTVGHRSNETMTRIKQLLKVNEEINHIFISERALMEMSSLRNGVTYCI